MGPNAGQASDTSEDSLESTSGKREWSEESGRLGPVHIRHPVLYVVALGSGG